MKQKWYLYVGLEGPEEKKKKIFCSDEYVIRLDELGFVRTSTCKHSLSLVRQCHGLSTRFFFFSKTSI